MERYYRAADVFMMLSRFDTFGMAVLEAMAAGLPVIVSGNVGARDVVAEGVNGFVAADPEDAGTVAARIVSLLDAGVRDRMGLHAFRAASGLSWDRVAATVAGIYREQSG